MPVSLQVEELGLTCIVMTHLPICVYRQPVTVPPTSLRPVHGGCETHLCPRQRLPVATCVLPQLRGPTVFFPQCGLALLTHGGLPDLLTLSI